ncbi:anti-sigma factor antagonist [Haematobacter massiliensis]|uniref:Anti-sigma factor antagonist n=1 Tax=Haematobacter massiliensis TaxID=195105 RepID=A0A086Y869_9RHOB|nr:STAS domain-containing protein [Haematobacter massiliensis]KFI30469.1 anti-anti-sigma factor [Haematobacter massiliensis]OWJ70946.1 anti-sigma factor antagonist [Haematobacter massiliensis]OWJ87486.1 anti-sigma factor antagonist [Haematobacter massiliensis]QBJ24941.1 anti-sigma factor antagonist [Haematobacter massiliensis]
MQLSARLTDGLLLIRVEESRIDAASAIAFKERMRHLTAEPAPRVILDMAEVAFLDSSGLGALVAVMKLLQPERRLELAGVTPMVAKVLTLTRMDRIFRILPPLDEAGPLPLAS